MEDIDKALGSAVSNLSDQNYSQSLAFYRFWIDIAQTYHQLSPDPIFDAIWKNRTSSIVPITGQLIHSTAHLILRLASDAESDYILAPHAYGLQSRLSSRTLQEFFTSNLRAARSETGSVDCLYTDANLIARWANLGYVEEAAIRDHILQSLISHHTLHDHQVDVLIILFKLSGATFEAYADPSVVDRCFELLKGHNYKLPDKISDLPHCHNLSGCQHCENYNNNYIRARRELVQVRAPRAGSERNSPG